MQVEVERRAGLPVESVAPRIIRLLRSLAQLALTRAVTLKVQRAIKGATNTVRILLRDAQGVRVKRRKGRCRRPL